MRGVMALVALSVSSATQAPRAPIEGLWKNPSGTAIIAIASCGREHCGKVAWASPRGQRDVAATTRSVVGTTVLAHVKAIGDHWVGALYVPDDNIHVSARLELSGVRGMKLTGCAFAGLFCRTQVWTRVDALPSGG